MSLPFESKEPLYHRIKRDLLVKIHSGWPVDKQLPTEEELQKKWKASRGTVRRALLELEMEGYVARKPGRGTFPRNAKGRVRKEVGQVVSFSQQVREAGFKPSSRVLIREVIKAYEAEGMVCEGFHIGPEEEVVWIKRLRLADQEPLAVQSVFLLPHRCPDIFAEDLSELMRLYAEKYGVRLRTADEVIRVSKPKPDDAQLLGVDTAIQVVIREQVSFDEQGNPFEVLHSVELAERFEYRYRVVSDASRLSFLSNAG